MISPSRQPVRIGNQAAAMADGSSILSFSISRALPTRSSSAGLRSRSRFSCACFFMGLRGFDPSGRSPHISARLNILEITSRQPLFAAPRGYVASMDVRDEATRDILRVATATISKWTPHTTADDQQVRRFPPRFPG